MGYWFWLGESLVFRFLLELIFGFATVAQLVELRIRNAMVAGSSPVCGSFRCGFAPFFIRYLWEYFIFSVGFVWSLVYVCMLRRLGVALAIL